MLKCILLSAAFLFQFLAIPETYAARRIQGYTQSYSYESAPPVQDRSESVYPYLEASVRTKQIAPKADGKNYVFYGSATVVRSDKDYAYAVACAHTFQTDKVCTVQMFYQHGKKLEKTADYDAEILAIDRNADISFIRFAAGYAVPCIPLASRGFVVSAGDKCLSAGCDASPPSPLTPAVYRMVVRSVSANWLITTTGPRGGRSGGSCFTLDGRYIGICVRTSVREWTDSAGVLHHVEGDGYFIPLNMVYAFADKSGLTHKIYNPLYSARIRKPDGSVVLNRGLLVPVP